MGRSTVLKKCTETGRTLLHYAAERGNWDKVPKDCLTVENLMMQDAYGRTPLHWAASHGQVEHFPKALFMPANLVMKDNDGYVPLHHAAERGQLDQFSPGLLTEANLMTRDINGRTPLHYAAAFGHLDQVPKELLTGEILLVQSKDGDTPLHCAMTSLLKSLSTSGKICANENLEPLVGLELPESVREVVGEDWWERNQRVIRAKQELGGQEEGTEIELF